RVDGFAFGLQRSDEGLDALLGIPPELLGDVVEPRHKRPLSHHKLPFYLLAVFKLEDEREGARGSVEVYPHQSRGVSLMEENVERTAVIGERAYVGGGGQTLHDDQSRLALPYRGGVDRNPRIMRGLRLRFLFHDP